MLISAKNAQTIVDEIKATIHRDINIMDEQGIIIASTNPQRIAEFHLGARKIIEEGLDCLIISERTEGGMQPGINLPIRIGGKLEGIVGITGNPDEVQAFGYIIQKMSEVMILGIRQKEEEHLLISAKLQFIEHWIFSEPNEDSEELRLRADFLGIDILAPHIVAVLQTSFDAPPPSPHTSRLGRAASHELIGTQCLDIIRKELSGCSQNFCFASGSKIIIIFWEKNAACVIDQLIHIRSKIESSWPVKIGGGVSSVALSPDEIHRCYREALIACRASLNRNDHRFISYENSSLEFIAYSIARDLGKNIVDKVFAGVSKEKARDLANFVQIFFNENGNLDSVASKLYVHRNTVQYRIGKIKKKTGYNLLIPKDACILYFAACLYERENPF